MLRYCVPSFARLWARTLHSTFLSIGFISGRDSVPLWLLSTMWGWGMCGQQMSNVCARVSPCFPLPAGCCSGRWGSILREHSSSDRTTVWKQPARLCISGVHAVITTLVSLMFRDHLHNYCALSKKVFEKEKAKEEVCTQYALSRWQTVTCKYRKI